VNRKDVEGNNLFSGGFLVLDNIGVFDRSKPLPTGGFLQQADGAAWMGFYCLRMLSIALELAEMNPVYEDMASKFFEHFIGAALWDEEDGFYDQLKRPAGRQIPLKTRSLVGLLPLIAVEVLKTEQIERMRGFKKRMEWFLDYREDLKPTITYCEPCSHFCHRMLATPTNDRLVRSHMLDEDEFLSPCGLRSVSRVHRDKPYVFVAGHEGHRVDLCAGRRHRLPFPGQIQLARSDLVSDQLPHVVSLEDRVCVVTKATFECVHFTLVDVIQAQFVDVVWGFRIGAVEPAETEHHRSAAKKR
jgi:hypothetical protein